MYFPTIKEGKSVTIRSPREQLIRVQFALAQPSNPQAVKPVLIHQNGDQFYFGVSTGQQLNIILSCLADAPIAVCVFLHPGDGTFNVCTSGGNVWRYDKMSLTHCLEMRPGDQIVVATTLAATRDRANDTILAVPQEPLIIESFDGRCGIVVEHALAESLSIACMWIESGSKRLGKHNPYTHFTPKTVFYMKRSGEER